jgi:Ferritin-like domain
MSNIKHASPELAAVEIRGMSRSHFLARSALATGGLYGAGAVGSFVSSAFAQNGGSEGDIEILNFALTLEFLEAAFYEEALSSANLSGDSKQLAELIGGHEKDHVDTLTGTIEDLGGTPVEAPQVKFPLSDEKSFLKLAQTLEDTGVAAYDGAAPMISSGEVLGAAGSIVQVEARHAAAIRFAAGNDPTRGAFEPTLKEAEVLKAVQPFIKA